MLFHNLSRRIAHHCVVLLVTVALAVAAHAGDAQFRGVSLNVADPHAAAEWYARNLGGQVDQVSVGDAVAFGDVTIHFVKATGDIAGSVGSVVDHLGFSYPDIDAKMRELAAAGVEIVSGVEQEGPIKYAFVRDRWHTLLEIVQDPEIAGFHHIHLATTDPKAALDWYKEVLGGERTRFAGLIGGMRYGNFWVLTKGVERPRAATSGRSIDHVLWSVADVTGTIPRLRAGGIFPEGAAQSSAPATSRITFDAPGGVRTELVEQRK